MTVLAIREKLHNYLEIADDKKVRAIYEIMEADIEENSIIYSDELKLELDNRYLSYLNDPSSVISAEESKSRTLEILNQISKK